jgi:hypothetical protein
MSVVGDLLQEAGAELSRSYLLKLSGAAREARLRVWELLRSEGQRLRSLPFDARGMAAGLARGLR